MELSCNLSNESSVWIAPLKESTAGCIDVKKVDDCVGDPEADEEKQVLKEEQEA